MCNLYYIYTTLLLCLMLCFQPCHSILYPRESETRTIKDLSGKWKFRIDDSPSRHQSFDEKWWNLTLANFPQAIDMPVPASYNDITQNKSIRDFSGWAWYQREFFVTKAWQQDMYVWLRIGSAHYSAIAWINSVQVLTHHGGHLPFESEVSTHLKFGVKNIITIAVNNTLTPNTLPPGTIVYESEDDHYPPGYFVQNIQFDFFNYAGIHRPVKLYTTSKTFVQDISVTTTCDSDFSKCNLKYFVEVHYLANKIKVNSQQHAGQTVKVSLLDTNGNVVTTGDLSSGLLTVSKPNLWWPVGMNESVAYLYTIVVEIFDENSNLIDNYRLPYGIRTIEVTDTKFLINGKQFYFLGFGKHEDWDIRGKGFDWSSVIKDFNMLEWLGGNSFRTSHYPYSEEIMQLCDERGIVVVDECPAVGLDNEENFSDKTLQHHKDVIRELINRDKNHASVVMWSVANEPNSKLPVSEEYFKTIISLTKSLDATRPVTVVCNQPYDKDLASAFVDVVSVNKYLAWYEDSGHTEVIQPKLGYYLSEWYETRHKPVIHMEWGAGTVVGLHRDPAVMFTEEFQEEVMEEHFKVFDSLRKDFLVGEMIWNYADFATAQDRGRVVGNRKGVLTRQRDPKSAAFVLRRRYHALRNQTLS
ncbi:beta-glucuronidase-like [Styela clava]